jgi:hypothetical protein
MAAHYQPPMCGCCKERPLPGRSRAHPDGDLLCDVCAKPTAADKALAAAVNARIAARKAAREAAPDTVSPPRPAGEDDNE